jgi:hypothetical protein
MAHRKFYWSNLLEFIRLSVAFIFLAVACTAQANSRADEIKHCLQDFDGIEWVLPYLPPIHIYSCASSTVKINSVDDTSNGHRKLVLIGELILGADAEQLSFDERYAALQLAVYTHFSVLFRQRGYRLVNTEPGDARTHYSRYTQCMLDGRPNCVKDSPEPPLPPIPYTSLARYVRDAGAQTITLVYKTEAKNTWSISLEGVPSTREASQ